MIRHTFVVVGNDTDFDSFVQFIIKLKQMCDNTGLKIEDCDSQISTYDKNDVRLMNVRETAEYLHIGMNKAYALFKRSDFPNYKIGNRRFTDKLSLDDYLTKKGVLKDNG